MSNDFLIRNSLYGFKKEDVIDYIEKIKKECQHHKDVAQKTQNDLNQANNKISMLEEKMKKLNEQLTSNENENKNKSQLVEVSKKPANDADIDNLKNEIDILKIQNENLTKECDKFKKSNKQVNTLILDAYIHSEGILKDARDKAQLIANSSQDIINVTTGDIEDFSDYVNNISTDFSQIVSELTSNIKKLTGNLISVTKGMKEPVAGNNDENELLESFEDLISKYVKNEDITEVNVKKNPFEDSHIIEPSKVTSFTASSDSAEKNVVVEDDSSQTDTKVEKTDKSKFTNDRIFEKIDEYVANNLNTEVKDINSDDKNKNEVKTNNKIKIKIKRNKSFEE